MELFGGGGQEGLALSRETQLVGGRSRESDTHGNKSKRKSLQSEAERLFDQEGLALPRELQLVNEREWELLPSRKPPPGW